MGIIKLIILVGGIGCLTYLVKSFNYLPLARLRSRAQAGDDKAWAIYRVRWFGLRAWFIIWFVLAFLVAVLFDNIQSSDLSAWQSLAVSIALLVGWLYLLTNRRPVSPNLAAMTSPPLTWLLTKIATLTRRPIPQSKRDWLQSTPSSGDQIDSLTDQIDDQEISHQARQWDRLSQQRVGNQMTAREQMKTIKQGVELTPGALDELYDLGFKYLPVTNNNQRQFVGLLHLPDLVQLNTKRPTTVKQKMIKPRFVQTDDQLITVLKKFVKSNYQLFLVRDKQSRVVGLITVSDILRQIINS